MKETNLNTIETEIEGVRAFVPPPEDFDPETASIQELSHYGFPARPDRALHPQKYVLWLRHFGGKSTRIIPKLTQTNVRHGVPRLIQQQRTIFSVATDHWSGIAVQDLNNPFSKPQTEITAEWNVPSASCVLTPPGTRQCSHWIGIDGWGSSSDVLQVGTNTSIDCPSQALTAHAWFEWYPDYEIRIDNLPVNTGDHIITLLYPWITNGQLTGILYIENRTASQHASVSLAPPAGVVLVGNSVEWIVERPKINNHLSELANYSSFEMTFCEAAVSGTGPGWQSYYPGQAPTGDIYNILMATGDPENTVSIAYVPPANVPDTISFSAGHPPPAARREDKVSGSYTE